MADPSDFAYTPPDQGNAYGPGITAGDATAAINNARPSRSMPDTNLSGPDSRLGDATYRYTGGGLRGQPIPETMPKMPRFKDTYSG